MAIAFIVSLAGHRRMEYRWLGRLWFHPNQLATLPWTEAALDSQPWQSVIYPMIAVCLIWPIWQESIRSWPTVVLMSALILSCFPLLAALCQAERHAPYFAGNTAWALAALMAIGLNWLVMQRLEDSGAGRWSLWILVGQSLTVAALIMTCYGRFGEWSTLVGLTLGVFAIGRIFISDQATRWSSAIALPVLALNSILIMHIREYRSVPLPIWFPALPFLLPTLVGAVDIVWTGRLHPIVRVIMAGVVTAALGAATIAIILALNGPTEEW